MVPKMAVRKITIRRGTASAWTSTNPTLSSGEMGFESDTGKFKIGTGVLAWTSLGYSNANLANASVDALSDVTVTSPSSGQVLKWNGSAWINSTDNAGTTVNSIDDIADVTITSVSSGQVLKWNGTAWVNSTDNAGTTINSIDDITDVTITSASSGQFLKWNGTAWVNDAIDLGSDTVGNYMSNVSAGTGISVSHTQGEGSTATLSLNASIDNLSDVTITSVSTGQVLKWNGSAWINDTDGGGTSSSTPHPFALLG
jgi:hypothetical protein